MRLVLIFVFCFCLLINYLIFRFWFLFCFSSKSVSIGGLNYKKNFQAIADTGTSLIYGDSTAIKKLMSKIGASYKDDYGYYVKESKRDSMQSKILSLFFLIRHSLKKIRTLVSMFLWKDVTFTMNGYDFPLTPYDYTVRSFSIIIWLI